MEYRLIPFSFKLNIAAKVNFLAYSEVLTFKSYFHKTYSRKLFDLLELAYIFEKCLKLLPWLQDLNSFFGRVGGHREW